ncbi:BLUF domain-containing protein [Methylorubrum sp. SB2]|uniref:BLUF domain-containing protein n=1 Tax=Methylorubrum subtropicum TaxID=3138812 RepID=UPI00313F3671
MRADSLKEPLALTVHRLLYRSDMHLTGSEADLRQEVAEIVRQSAARNAESNLTGALLHSRGVFIQVLEGPLPALETTFERICCDLRHRRVELLEFTQAAGRVFPEWSMTSVPTDGSAETLFRPFQEKLEQAFEAVSAQTAIHLLRSLIVVGSDSDRAKPAATRSASSPGAGG